MLRLYFYLQHLLWCLLIGRLVVKTPSAFVALVTSLFKLEVIVASPLVRSVVSVLRLVVKTLSAVVALVTSARQCS